MDNNYDDSDSQDNSEDDFNDTQVKHGMNYLKSQELYLKQQMD